MRPTDADGRSRAAVLVSHRCGEGTVPILQFFDVGGEAVLPYLGEGGIPLFHKIIVYSVMATRPLGGSSEGSSA